MFSISLLIELILYEAPFGFCLVYRHTGLLFTSRFSPLSQSSLNGTLVDEKGRQASQYPSSCAGFLHLILAQGCLNLLNWFIACKWSRQYCFAYLDCARFNLTPQPSAIHSLRPLVLFLAIILLLKRPFSRPYDIWVSSPCRMIDSQIGVVSWDSASVRQ